MRAGPLDAMRTRTLELDTSTKAHSALKPCANVLRMAGEGNLSIDVSREPERVVLRLNGELDLASVPTARERGRGRDAG